MKEDVRIAVQALMAVFGTIKNTASIVYNIQITLYQFKATGFWGFGGE